MGNKFKNIDYRIILGTLLILGGILGVLEKFNLIFNASAIFWAIIFGIAGVAFLYIFFTNQEHWWSMIPGSALLGLAITVGLPEKFSMYGGLAFLGALGLGFLFIYFVNRKNWWAIIPSGVLITLGIVSIISDQMRGQDSGAFFFIGIGLTFLMVAILPNKTQRMNWAFIPAAVLLIFGTLLGSAFRGWLDYLWIGALFCGGIYMVWRFMRTPKP